MIDNDMINLRADRDALKRIIQSRVDIWHIARMGGPGANPIPEYMAREIASWHQTSASPQYCSFAAYAQNGTITDDLIDDYTLTYEQADLDQRRHLSAMWARVKITPVTAWIAIRAHGPYAPDPDSGIHGSLDWGTARDTLIDWVGSAPDDHVSGDDCTCVGDTLCTYHRVEAHAQAIRADMRTVPTGIIATWSLDVDPDGHGLPWTYMLSMRPMSSYDAYLDAYNDHHLL